VTSRRRRTLVGILLAGSLLLGACGGDDDEGSGGGSTEEFCASLEIVRTRGQELSETDLDSDADLPLAKERLLALVDAFDRAIAAAPAEIEDEAAQVTGLTSQVRARVEEATTADDIREEVPLLVSVLAENSNQGNRISDPIITFAKEECGF
jgi:hypothetical protein